MAGLERIARITESEQNCSKIIKLRKTSRKVGIHDKSSRFYGQYPVFPYHFRQGEVHCMGNLGLEVREICSQSRTVDLVFKGDGDLSSLSVEDEVLSIGDVGRMALRKIEGNLVKFDVCLNRGFQLRQIDPPFPPLE